MLDPFLTPLTFVAALGSGLIGGTFFAFSTFVMRALGKLPPAAGLSAMQSVNVVVLNPVFLGVFVGTAALSAAAAVLAVVRWDRPGSAWLLAGGLLYVVGTFGVTVAANVPMNDALAAVAESDPDAGRKWEDYQSRWTAWNHVRTVAALAALGSFVVALRL